jgi:protein phosphatase 1 regulatory subunit 7
VKLTTLDISSNYVPALENLSHLSCLEELWVGPQNTLRSTLFTCVSQMNGNQIPDPHSLESELGSIKALETIYLEGNPCQKNDMTGYRRKIMLALPHLKQIDAT